MAQWKLEMRKMFVMKKGDVMIIVSAEKKLIVKSGGMN